MHLHSAHVAFASVGLALCISLTACDGGGAGPTKRAAPTKQAPASADEQAEKEAAAKAAAAAEAAKRAQARRDQKRPLSELFPPGAVDLPTPLAGARFGMTADATRAAVPALTDSTTLTPEAFEGVTIRVQYFNRSKTLRLVQVALPAAEAPALLESRWGPPVPSAGARCWTNEQTGVQAVLDDGGKLLLRAFLPWRSILGVSEELDADDVKPDGGVETKSDDAAKKKPETSSKKQAKKQAKKKSAEGDAYPALGVEPEPLLGMSLEQVKSAYAEALRDSTVVSDARVVLTLPPHECSAKPTFIDLSVTEGVVSRVHLKLEYRSDADREAIATALKAKYGDAVATKDAVSTHYSGRVKVVVSHAVADRTYSLFISAKGK